MRSLTREKSILLFICYQAVIKQRVVLKNWLNVHVMISLEYEIFFSNRF